MPTAYCRFNSFTDFNRIKIYKGKTANTILPPPGLSYLVLALEGGEAAVHNRALHRGAAAAVDLIFIYAYMYLCIHAQSLMKDQHGRTSAQYLKNKA